MELERTLGLIDDPAALELLPAEHGLTGGCIVECEPLTLGPPTTICCGGPGQGTWCTNTIPDIRTTPV